MYLADINVWLALTFESHFHHPPALQWFEGLQDSQAAFCRLTQQGYLRLATNPSAFGEAAVTLAQAWRFYDALLADERVLYVSEPDGMDLLWRTYTSKETYSPKIWNDAYLASLASVGQLTIVTFDRAFDQFKETESLLLS